MTKAKRHALIVAVVGFVTAVIGLGAALVGYATSANEVSGQVRDAANKAKAAETRQHVELCTGHRGNIDMIEARFAELQATHGLLIRNLRTCQREKDDGDKSVCATIVCGAAWAVSGGRANCIDAATQAMQLEAGVHLERDAAARDQCALPASALLAFMAE